MPRPKITYLIFKRSHFFGFDTTISLDAKTCSVPQFIGASQCNFEIANLEIESLVPLALDRWVNPSDTLVLVIEIIHHSWPPHAKD